MITMTNARRALVTQACLTCRKQKRKCTREVPACALCRKNGRQCEYDATARTVTDNEDLSNQPIGQSSSRSPSSTLPVLSQPCSSRSAWTAPLPVTVDTDFPATFFLDYEQYQLGRGSLHRPCFSLPDELMSCLTGEPQMRYDVDVYFNSFHSSFPIVSKLRLYRELSSSQGKTNADTTLLLVSMQLHTHPSDGTEPLSRDLYKAAKSCFSYVETSNIFSIRLLQAGILIALYEISNAIYPSAYFSVGHCARLGYAMGIHDRKGAPQMLDAPRTSTDLEERRRVWWAVNILDRYVNIGGRNRPSACEDSRPSTCLPVDDKYWDQGELTVVQPLAVSSSTTIRVCPYARTCQAAHLLSRVMRHMSDTESDADFRYQEAIQLHRTAQALYATILSASDDLIEQMSDPAALSHLCTALSLCLSTLFNLYDGYCCTDNFDADQMGNVNLLEMQKTAISGLKSTSSAASQFARRIRAMAELGGLLKVNALMCDCLYQAAGTYVWFVQETGNRDHLPQVVEIKEVLELLGHRWELPRAYLRILNINASLTSETVL